MISKCLYDGNDDDNDDGDDGKISFHKVFKGIMRLIEVRKVQECLKKVFVIRYHVGIYC